MTQCYAEGKKHSSNGYGLGLYAGIFNHKLHSSHKSNSNVDQYSPRSNGSSADKHTADEFKNKSRMRASGQMLNRCGAMEANALHNGAYPVMPNHSNHQQNRGLVVGAGTSRGNGNGRKERDDLVHSVGASICSNGSGNEPVKPKYEYGGMSDVIRGRKSVSGEFAKCEMRTGISNSVHERTVANDSPVDASESESGNQKSGELKSCSTGESKVYNSGEQNTVSLSDSTVSKARTNGGNMASLKGSPNVGTYAGRNVLEDPPSHGGSSNGSSPSSEVVGVGRLSSVSDTTGNGHSPPSVSSRGVGNITGNMGKVKISVTKAASNENIPVTPALRATNGTPRKSADHVQAMCGNLRGISTGRISADGNLGGGFVTGMKTPAIKGTPRMSPLTKNGTWPGTPSVGNLIRGTLNGNLANIGSGNVSNGAAGCKFNGKATSPNGNVLCYSAGTKCNSKTSEGNRNGLDFYRAGSSDPEEVKNVGNEYYKRGQFSEALALYDKAIALCPSNAAYRGNRAAALTGLGRLGEAAQECEETIKLDSSYTRVHQRLASLYLRFGLVESAKRHFQSAGQQADLGDVQRLHDIDRHISRCIEARKTSDWRNVIRESDAAVVAGADSAPQVFGYKSEALLKLHRLEEADEVCTAAQRVECSLIRTGVVPVDAFLHMIRGEIDIVLGRFEGAIQAAESAVRIDSRNSEAVALLRKARAICQSRTSGNECFKAGRFFEACALYGEGLESDPTNAVLLCNRAACRSKLGQWEKAVEDCSAALNVQPNYTKALMRRADCSIKLERWEDALRDYEALRREMPSDMEVARALFDVQVAIKKSRGEEIYKMKFGGDVEVVSNNEQFRDAVTSPGLAVVQFNTRWSDHCRQISPFVDQLCKRFPCVNFLKVDVDDNPYLARTESVSFVPTFKIYKNGQKVKDILGPSQQALEYAVKHYSL